MSEWKYISGAPGLKCIFLSTDDEDLLSQVDQQNNIISIQMQEKRHEMRVIRTHQYSQYDKIDETTKVILDLLLLSKTRTLLFTFSSNFGQLAMFMKPNNLVPNFAHGILPGLIPIDFYHHVKFGHKTYGYFLTRNISKNKEGTHWIIFPVPFQKIRRKLMYCVN